MIYITGGGETLDKLAQRFASGNVNAYRKRLAECNRNTQATKVYPGGAFLAPDHPVWIPVAGEEVSTIEREAIVRELEFLPAQKRTLIARLQKENISPEQFLAIPALLAFLNDATRNIIPEAENTVRDTSNLVQYAQGSIKAAQYLNTFTGHSLNFKQKQLKAFEAAITDFQSAVSELKKSKQSSHNSPLGTSATTINTQTNVYKNYQRVQQSFAELAATASPRQRSQRLGTIANSQRIWSINSEQMARTVTKQLGYVKSAKNGVWYIGVGLSAVDFLINISKGDSGSKAGAKAIAGVTAAGMGYYTVSFGLIALGLTPIGWGGDYRNGAIEYGIKLSC